MACYVVMCEVALLIPTVKLLLSSPASFDFDPLYVEVNSSRKAHPIGWASLVQIVSYVLFRAYSW